MKIFGTEIDVKEFEPMPLTEGPPFPKSWGVHWPWYKVTPTPPPTPAYVIAVGSYPPDGGLATKSPNKTKYTYDEKVTLTAYAYSGWKFSHWAIDGLREDGNPVDLIVKVHSSVLAHFTEVIVPTVYTCPTCGQQFSSQAELDRHIATAHPTLPGTKRCPYEGLMIASQNYAIEPPIQLHNFDEYEAHLRSVHIQRAIIDPWTYPAQGWAAKQAQAWETENRIMAAPNPWSQARPEDFRETARKASRENAGLEGSLYICFLCGQEFDSYSAFEIHLVQVHGYDMGGA